MTQGFDEFYSGLELQCLNTQEVGELCFEVGAASRQAEIDELQKRINLALSAVWNDELNHIVIDILRGESDE